MDATKLPKGQSPEKSEIRNFEPGVYKNKDTGAEFFTAPGSEGSIQADALMSPVWKDVWEWNRELPSREELLKIRKEQEVKDATSEALLKGQEAAELKEATKAAVAKAKEEVAVN